MESSKHLRNLIGGINKNLKGWKTMQSGPNELAKQILRNVVVQKLYIDTSFL